MPVTPANQAQIQALLDADPQYRRDLSAFQGGSSDQKPQFSIALLNDLNRVVPYSQLQPGRYAVGLGGDGRVTVEDRNNPWTSPGTWGPIIVGGLGGAAALGALGPTAGTAATADAGVNAAVSAAPEFGVTDAALSSGTLAGLAPTTAAGVGAAGGGSTGILDMLASLGTNTAENAGTDWLSQLIKGSQGQSPLGNLSNVLGGAAGGAANLGVQVGQLGTNQAVDKANIEQKIYDDALQQALFKQMTAPSAGASMAVRGDLLNNVQDVTPHYAPGSGYSFSGGIRPSALGPNARRAGANLSNAGLALQGGGNMPSVPTMPNFPNLPPTTPSGLQTGLQYGALGSSILAALLKQNPSFLQQLMKQGGQQTPSPDPNYQTVGPLLPPPDPTQDPTQDPGNQLYY